MCFFSRQSKYNFQGTQEANVGKAEMLLLQGHISDEERRGMQPALLGLWRHSSENTLCKDLISVHNRKDAQKELGRDLFPIQSKGNGPPYPPNPALSSATLLAVHGLEPAWSVSK